MSKRKVVFTGAIEAFAGRMLAEFRKRYDLTLFDIRSIKNQGKEVPGIQIPIFYGISNNTLGFWSTNNAREVMGFSPEDDSLIRSADKLSAFLQVSFRKNQADYTFIGDQ